jgi:hypothetical protein
MTLTLSDGDGSPLRSWTVNIRLFGLSRFVYDSAHIIRARSHQISPLLHHSVRAADFKSPLGEGYSDWQMHQTALRRLIADAQSLWWEDTTSTLIPFSPSVGLLIIAVVTPAFLFLD